MTAESAKAMSDISVVDFESDVFTKQARGLLIYCEGNTGKLDPCSHGRKGAALSFVLNVSIRRGRDLYQGRARYSRAEAIALLDHVGVSAEVMRERCKPPRNLDPPSPHDQFRADQVGHSLALAVWAHADDRVFVEQCISELLLAAKDDPSIDLERVARQALVDLALGLRERFAGHRDRIPGAAVIGVDFLT